MILQSSQVKSGGAKWYAGEQWCLSNVLLQSGETRWQEPCKAQMKARYEVWYWDRITSWSRTLWDWLQSGCTRKTKIGPSGWFCVWFRPSQYQNQTLTSWDGSAERQHNNKEPWSHCIKEVAELDLFCLKKRELSNDLNPAFIYFIRMGTWLFLKGHSEWTRNNRTKLQPRKFQSDSNQKQLFVVRTY